MGMLLVIILIFKNSSSMSLEKLPVTCNSSYNFCLQEDRAHQSIMVKCCFWQIYYINFFFIQARTDYETMRPCLLRRYKI